MQTKGFPKTLNMNNSDAVHRFIGGRKRYNSWRQFKALLRRREVAKLLLQGLKQSEIAERLEVHRSTISRDVAWLHEEARKNRICHCCGQPYRNVT